MDARENSSPIDQIGGAADGFWLVWGVRTDWKTNQRIKNEGFQLAATGTLRKLAGRLGKYIPARRPTAFTLIGQQTAILNENWPYPDNRFLCGLCGFDTKIQSA